MNNIGDTIKDWLWALKRNRKAQALLAIAVVLIIALIVLAVYLQRLATQNNLATNANTNGKTNNVNSARVSEKLPRRLDGVEVKADQSNRLPISVVIENLVSVRPQSGLSSAQVVYETLAEGGITRFLAIYATDEAITQIGPVRSARHYFVDLAEEYGGLFTHVGGSPQALGILGSSDYITDFNQFTNSQYFYRDANIGAPHNVFTTSELLTYALRDLNLLEAEGEYDPYIFKKQVAKADRPTDTKPITIDFSNDDYAVEWRYDVETNTYKRWNAGVEHLDKNTNEQLTAKNIVIQRVTSTLLEADTGRLDITTTGTGEAVIFQDGTTTVGSWKKDQRGDRTTFYDTTGKAIEFNPGVTWIELVPTDTTVTY